MPLIGAHMPTGKGLGDAIRRGHSIGCNAVQVFTSSPQQWKSKDVTDQIVESVRLACSEACINHLVSHDSYLVNLAAPDPELREKSVAALTGELNRCALLGIPLVVSHMGAHMGQGEPEGLRLVAENARRVLEESDDSVTLLMETTAGQGSSLNYRFEHLATIFEMMGIPDRLGICLDTCHMFAAGYDLSTNEGYESVMDQLNHMVGCEKVRAIHANDSKKALGSRVDRHEHIGEGSIGQDCFRCLVNDPRWKDLPIVVETPEAETMHSKNVSKLLSFVNE
ncbi:MAG: deoxyribonuclease IV [Armatimonadetes bacterium]|nr:deoxyribonuclease IV [Armatimonadota bacterium]